MLENSNVMKIEWICYGDCVLIFYEVVVILEKIVLLFIKEDIMDFFYKVIELKFG